MIVFVLAFSDLESGDAIQWAILFGILEGETLVFLAVVVVAFAGLALAAVVLSLFVIVEVELYLQQIENILKSIFRIESNVLLSLVF